MLLTLDQLRNSRLVEIASACSSSSAFSSLVNEATEALMNRGSWWGTVQPISCAIYSNKVTWPRYVGTVLAMNVCDKPVDLYNKWYRFMPFDAARHPTWAGNSSNNNWYWGNAKSDMAMTSPVFNQMNPAYPMPVQIYIENSADAGKNIILFGKDSNGQVIRSLRSDGSYQEGLAVAMQYPYTQTPVSFQIITRVLKDTTTGPVRMYQIDLSNSVKRDLAYYEPSETSPEYVVSKLDGVNMDNADSFGYISPRKVDALVKLSFVPVVNGQDLVQIDNVRALKFMIQSIKLDESGDPKASQEYELKAFREMNYEMRNKYPIEQFTVSFRPFGSARLERQQIGTVY